MMESYFLWTLDLLQFLNDSNDNNHYFNKSYWQKRFQLEIHCPKFECPGYAETYQANALEKSLKLYSKFRRKKSRIYLGCLCVHNLVLN